MKKQLDSVVRKLLEAWPLGFRGLKVQGLGFGGGGGG